jgi:DNA ligase D-like protein (predicted 3'-phosphoesterase)
MRSNPKSGELLPPAAADRGSGVRLTQTDDTSIINRRGRSTYPQGKSVRRSGATPGPSTDPREKRLAVPTEDHPLEYANFEGIIPEGEYGAGAVIVWDRGSFENRTERDGERIPITDALSDGHAVVRLNGSKLRGGYALQRTRSGKDERWLLIKVADDDADARRNPVSTEPKSVRSGMTVRQLARDSAQGSDSGS